MANVPVSPELLEISVIVVNLDIMAFHQVDAGKKHFQMIFQWYEFLQRDMNKDINENSMVVKKRAFRKYLKNASTFTKKNDTDQFILDDATATTKVVLPLIVMRLDNVNVKIMLMVNSVINVQLISSTWIPTILKVVKLASVMVMEYHVQRFKVLDFKE